MKPKLAILGCTGFLGTLVSDFFDREFDVVGLHGTGPSSRNNDVSVDARNSSRFLETLREIGPTYILNFMGSRSKHDLNDSLMINAEVSRALMVSSGSLSKPLKKIIFIGSAAEYGNTEKLPIDEMTPLNPVSIYGLSKTIQTTYFRFLKSTAPVSWNLVRPFNLISERLPESLAVGAFVKKIRETKVGGSFPVGNLSVKRDFVSTADFCLALQAVLKNGRSGEEYNVATNRSYSLNEVLRFLLEKSGKNLRFDEQVSSPGETHIMDSRGSYEKIQQDCGWQPTETVMGVLNRLAI